MRLLRASIAGLAIVVGAADVSAQRPPRERISIDDGWRFQKNDPSGDRDVRLSYDSLKAWILPTGNAFIRDASRWYAVPAEGAPATPSFVRADFDDTRWRASTCRTTGRSKGRSPRPAAAAAWAGCRFYGVGWYRRNLDIPAADAGQSIFLDVDGAMSYAAVWLNGQLVGGWPYGYASWRVDLTPYLKPGGANAARDPPRQSRPTRRAGIRAAASTATSGWSRPRRSTSAQWGTYRDDAGASRATSADGRSARVDDRQRLAADATRQRVPSRGLRARRRRQRRPATPVASVGGRRTVTVPPARAPAFSRTVRVAHPRLWGPPPTQTPNRYVAVTTVRADGAVVDRYETPLRHPRRCSFDRRRRRSRQRRARLTSRACE